MFHDWSPTTSLGTPVHLIVEEDMSIIIIIFENEYNLPACLGAHRIWGQIYCDVIKFSACWNR